MKKDELLTEIQTMNEKLFITDCQLPVCEDCSKFPYDIIKEGYNYIKNLMKLYEEFKEAYDLIPPELWKRYFIWEGFEQHVEYQMLMKAKKQLISATRKSKLPKFFKKTTWRKYDGKKKSMYDLARSIGELRDLIFLCRDL